MRAADLPIRSGSNCRVREKYPAPEISKKPVPLIQNDAADCGGYMILLKILQHFLLRIRRIRPKWDAICIVKCIAGALAQRSKILFKFLAKIITLSSTGGKLHALHADVFQGIHKTDEPACCGPRAFIQVNDINFILREPLF